MIIIDLIILLAVGTLGLCLTALAITFTYTKVIKMLEDINNKENV